MKDSFPKCDGSLFQVPLFDPIVATHFSNSANITDHLIDQMKGGSIYDKIFAGKKDLTFLDIGANIGLISIYASPACKRIVALEPAPNTYPILCAMTIGETNIEAHDIALAPKDGDSIFYLNDLNPTASSTVNTYGERTMVRGMTLSSILRVYQLEHVDVCKIDAEGAEGDSLTFKEIEYAKGIIDSWYIEFHNCPKSAWEVKMANTAQNLLRSGYSHFTVDGMTMYAQR